MKMRVYLKDIVTFPPLFSSRQLVLKLRVLGKEKRREGRIKVLLLCFLFSLVP